MLKTTRWGGGGKSLLESNLDSKDSNINKSIILNETKNLDSKENIESNSQNSNKLQNLDSKTQDSTKDSNKNIESNKFQNYKIYNFSHPNNQNYITCEMPSDKSPPISLTYKTHFKFSFVLNMFIIYIFAILLYLLAKKYSDKNRILNLKNTALLILFIAAILRIYEYIFCRDIWLDESMLAYSMYATSWHDIFFQALPSAQAAPAGFLILSKIIGYPFHYNEHSLYFLPFISGLLLLFLTCKISFLDSKMYNFTQNVESKNTESNFFAACFITLVCGSYSLLHFSTSFKQYESEAACAFLLVYIFLAKKSFKTFIFTTIFCAFFSYTIFFIAFGLGFGYLYRAILQSTKDSYIKNFLLFLRENIVYIAILLIFTILYYFLYIRYQATQYFYDWWDETFLPHNLSKYPAFIRETWLPPYSTFTSFGNIGVIFCLVLHIFGYIFLWKNKRDLCMACVAFVIIHLALSWFKIYPFGHSSYNGNNFIIGARLSLYTSVIFFILTAFGALYIYRLKNVMNLCIAFLLVVMMLQTYKMCDFVFSGKYIIHNVKNLIKDISLDSKIFVYESARPTLDYYLYQYNKKAQYEVFGNDGKQNDKAEIEFLRDKIMEIKNTDSKVKISIFVCESNDNLIERIPQLAKEFDKNVKVIGTKNAFVVIFSV